MAYLQAPHPGWYPAPDLPGTVRWWDGYRWTEHRAPALVPPAAPGSGDAIAWLLPVNRSGLAVAAGYLGLFALTGILAPVALVVGVLALRDLGRRPGVLGRGRAWCGVVMGSLFTLLMVVGVLSSHH